MFKEYCNINDTLQAWFKLQLCCILVSPKTNLYRNTEAVEMEKRDRGGCCGSLGLWFRKTGMVGLEGCTGSGQTDICILVRLRLYKLLVLRGIYQCCRGGMRRRSTRWVYAWQFMSQLMSCPRWSCISQPTQGSCRHGDALYLLGLDECCSSLNVVGWWHGWKTASCQGTFLGTFI